MNDEILFADDDEEEILPIHDGTWKVLIVDDEPEIHAVTKLALSDFALDGKGLTFISAYNGAEAVDALKQHKDIAVILLDVVMETEDAGLRVANAVRNELHNHFTRIILRTGQPGQAPERSVIVDYDINDYKSKTELTAQKLFTVMIASLRSYRDIMAIEDSRVGLEKVLLASTDLFNRHSLEQFMEGLIHQLSSVLGCSKDAAYITSAIAGHEPLHAMNSSSLYVFAGNGDYAQERGKLLENVLTTDQYKSCIRALRDKQIVFADDHIVAHCAGKSGEGALLYLTGLHRKVSEIDRLLVKLFAENVQIAFENVMRINQTKLFHNRIIEQLSRSTDLSEQSSVATLRVSALAGVIGQQLELGAEALKTMRLAMPLMGLEYSCLTQLLLNGSNNDISQCVQNLSDYTKGYKFKTELEDGKIITLALTMAKQHLEFWDGTGYPHKLTSKAIAIESQIVAAAHVFNTLICQQAPNYQWPLQDVVAFFEQQSGRAFHPDIVNAIVHQQEALNAVQQALPSSVIAAK